MTGREPFLDQLRRFPDWQPHEWLGASLMVLGAMFTAMGLAILLGGAPV